MSKKTSWKGPIALGVADAAFGGVLGAALGEWMEVLQGAAIYMCEFCATA